MLFTTDAQLLIDRAKDVAWSHGEGQLTVRALATAVVADAAAARRLAECLGVDVGDVRCAYAPPARFERCPGRLPLHTDVRELLRWAHAAAARRPHADSPELIGLPHLAVALARALPSEGTNGLPRPDDAHVEAALARWIEEGTKPPTLADLTRRLRALRAELRRRIHGQDDAIWQFVDGLFNTEVVGATDSDRRRPCGLFLFAGPPGVGKTHLAELAAGYLGRPFARFDMSGYAQSHEAAGLTGMPRSYQGAHPGALTGFVQQHPRALLLFDEIEKAHTAAVQLFLQLLDGGRLQDAYTENVVHFHDTIVIFTTNVGRSLYEDENSTGVQRSNPGFHRRTILDALRTEIDPRTRAPFFPAAICSRLATGHPILFRHLRVNDLTEIARAELARLAALLERSHGQQFRVAPEIPLALVMREGATTDARTVKAQAEVFLKEEVFKACQLFADERLDAAVQRIDEIRVELDGAEAEEVTAGIFDDSGRPSVLLVADRDLGPSYARAVPEVDWTFATSDEQAFEQLVRRMPDFVLLDLSLRDVAREASSPRISDSLEVDGTETLSSFDHKPLTARRFVAGQRLLEQLRARMSDVPVFLLSQETVEPGGGAGGVDEELLLACIRAGGARGTIRTRLAVGLATDADARARLHQDIVETARGLRRERQAMELGRRSEVLAFDTAPVLAEGRRVLRIRLRNTRLVRAVRSGDVDAVVSDAERPSIGFADVIGAAGAKEALGFVRDWLREPRRFAAAGVAPPRGILLTGPPGTGKTMLARALAGESECAFLARAASSFADRWVGSGEQMMRQLFATARRYAPSIVFIDEIDSIGRDRGSISPGNVGHAEGQILNQLLSEMDGFSRDALRPVIVIAATNHTDTLDPALRRRFNRVVEVELPTRLERAQYLRLRLFARTHHAVSAEMIDRIAAQSAGLSIADLENVMNQAAVLALAHDGLLGDTVLGEAFERVTMGDPKAGADPKRTARHEAGHALLMCLAGSPPIYVTIVGRGSFGGYAATEDPEERRSQTRLELEDRICQLLGGREAERLFYGEGAGDSTGPSNDLQQATRIAEAMVYDLGMSDEVGFVRVDRRRPLSDELALTCHDAVRKIIARQSERAHGLLAEHRPSLERIVAALLERDRLLREEVLALLTREERALAEPVGASR